MITVKNLEITNRLAIEFEDFKVNFLPKLRDFLLQISQLKQKVNKNEAAFEDELRDFLRSSFYGGKHIGKSPYKKGEADLVIAENKKSDTDVLIEVKSPLDKKDFITNNEIKKKSFFQVVTYFLIEIIEKQNFNLKTILITNCEEFYLFDTMEFHRLFYKSNLRKEFENWYDKKQVSTSIEDFYKQVSNFIENSEDAEIEAFFVSLADKDLLQEVEFAIAEKDIDEFNKVDKFQNVKTLYHFFSPALLLKEKEQRDGNELNRRFYFELLHILGLEEYKDKEEGLQLIGRKNEKERSQGSFIENAIEKIRFERPFHLQKQDDSRYDEQEGDFELALELCIIWINRILFLKLLEGQLQRYHSDKTFQFLTPEIIRNGNKLSTLFFHVLNAPLENRTDTLKIDFEQVPYLNSGLFQIQYVEILHGRISGLRDDLFISPYKNTVLKNAKAELPALNYLFQFLDSYNFGEVEKLEVQHQTKDLINASVLGKIFEKLNGYKEGSFYTPSYISMYMSQKVVRTAILNKFKERYKVDFQDFDDLKRFTISRYKKEDILAANQLINEITVCDPSVGSGHFLVSVLNEFIAAKSELGILCDDNVMPLPYFVVVENDELLVKDRWQKDRTLDYKVEFQNGNRTVNSELQKIQTTLFQEKKTIIENCLYGVDVNPNSVQICRLRLWIELLKNAYYTAESHFKVMETLPNLDYKIVEGNSLLPVYEKQAIMIDWKRKQSDTYSIRTQIETINNAIQFIKKNKKIVFNMENYYKKINLLVNINRAKADLLVAKFEIEILQMNETLRNLNPEQRLDKQLTKSEEKQRAELLEKKAFLQKIKREIDYSPDLGKPIILFDWSIDFAEILGTLEHGNGEETEKNHGFDVIIGNPPYIQQRKIGHIAPYLKELYPNTYPKSGTADMSVFFFEKGLELVKNGGQLAYISTNKFFNSEYGKELRNHLAKSNLTQLINLEQVIVFDEALVSPAIFHFKKEDPQLDGSLEYVAFYKEKITPREFPKEVQKRINTFPQSDLRKAEWLFNSPLEEAIIEHVKQKGKPLGEIESIVVRRGITTGYDKAFVVDENTFNKLAIGNNRTIFKPLLWGENIHKYTLTYKNYWLIHTHNGRPKVLDRINVEKDFPLIYAYFLSLNVEKNNAIATRSDKGEHWTNLRNCAFIDKFEQEKMVWGLISGLWGFAYDNKGYFLTSASYFLISEKIPLKFLIALFNSRLFQFYFDKTGEYTAGGAYVLKKKNIEKFIIPIQEMDYSPFIFLVDSILATKEKEENTDILEKELNKKVYELYGITNAQQLLIEGILEKKKLK